WRRALAGRRFAVLVGSRGAPVGETLRARLDLVLGAGSEQVDVLDVETMPQCCTELDELSMHAVGAGGLGGQVVGSLLSARVRCVLQRLKFAAGGFVCLQQRVVVGDPDGRSRCCVLGGGRFGLRCTRFGCCWCVRHSPDSLLLCPVPFRRRARTHVCASIQLWTRARSASLTPRALPANGFTGTGRPPQAGTAMHLQWSWAPKSAVSAR